MGSFDSATGTRAGPKNGLLALKAACPAAVIGGGAFKRGAATPAHTPLMSLTGAGAEGFLSFAAGTLGRKPPLFCPACPCPFCADAQCVKESKAATAKTKIVREPRVESIATTSRLDLCKFDRFRISD